MSTSLCAAVLVVEDDPSARDLLAREAADAGHAVQAVGDADAALAAMRRRSVDVLVTDIRLPGAVTGLQLAALVRSLHPETEVVLVTGFATIDVAIEGMKIGACDFLLKPLDDLGLVRSCIARAAARARQRAEDRRAVESLRARAAGRSALLDRMPVAVLLVDAGGVVRDRNRAAEELFAAADGLFEAAGGRIAASPAAAQRRLDAAIRGACHSGGAPVATIRIDRPSGASALRVVVAPLSPRAQGEGGDEPLVAILVEDPAAGALLPAAEILARLYGLTAAEAQFAARLVAGESVQEACEALGIAVPTGRTHLSRIFQKTETRRQGDLIGLILRGPALLAAATPTTDAGP